MLLSKILDTDFRTLAFSARDHARITAAHHPLASKALSSSDWTCYKCRTRIPDFMEVDHVGGHTEDCKKLEAICQFCHNLEHPLWAASRGRILFIYAPEFTQAQLHRLAWALLSRRTEEGFPVDQASYLTALNERRNAMEKILGARTVEGFFEAVFSLEERLGKEMAQNALLRVDQTVRFWPAEVTAEYEDLPPASRISTWTAGGFQVGARVGARLLRESMKVNPEALRLAARHADREGKRKDRA